MVISSQLTMWTMMAGQISTVLWTKEEPGGTRRAASPISTECTTCPPVLCLELWFIEQVGMVGTTP